LQNNNVLGNIVSNNKNEGISWGSDDNNGNAAAVANMFAGNRLSKNGGGGCGRNGDGKMNILVGNADADGLSPGLLSAGGKLCTVFDPLHLEKAF